MTFALWLTFAAASAVVLVIPGPTILLVLSYALSQGRRVAVASALGVALGDFLAMSASLLGLGALIAASANAFALLKWAGAVYLIWLGVKMLREAGKTAPAVPVGSQATRPGAVFRHMAIVTALNPKPIAFFIAFVPQFLRPEAPMAPQILILIATFVTLGTLNALAYALVANRLRRLVATPRADRWLGRIGGATLITLGLLTASMKRVTN